MKACLVLPAFVLLLGLAGCATSLEKANRFYSQGNFVKANTYFLRAVDEQKSQAVLPEWNGKGYAYHFSAPVAAAAIFGAGNCARQMQRRNLALYYYFYYVQFVTRHSLDTETQFAEIREYLRHEDANGDDAQRLNSLLRCK